MTQYIEHLENLAVDVTNHVAEKGFSAQALEFVRNKLQEAHDLGAGILKAVGDKVEEAREMIDLATVKAEGAIDTVENKVSRRGRGR